MSSAHVSETPLQKAIDAVKTLMSDQPALKGPLAEVLVQLTSRDLLAPTLFSDESKLGAMDEGTREWLESNAGGGGRRLKQAAARV